MEKIHEKIPNSTLVVIEKAGHDSPLEKTPEVNQNIIEFLNS
jgi:pimeloyl-ACP methyl ester carboxylesterase